MFSNRHFFSFLQKHIVETIIFLFSFSFSFWLMFSTFSYKNGSMLIATKAWSDFASHIPLIRSFSLSSNFPPQYPIFPGEPIRYHYLFYLLVGMLEKLGLRIDWALNLPSALFFFALMLIIYFFAKYLFKSKAVGILSLIFFLFNGSFSFLEFFKLHPLSLNSLNDIILNKTFPSFGPYDSKLVSAFWNLNIYTNQRHLALGLAILFLIVFTIIRAESKKKNLPPYQILIFSILIGIMPLLHSSVFLMIFAVLSILLIFFPYQRKSLFFILLISILLSLPRLYFLKEVATFTPHIQPGYLITDRLSALSFIRYWFMNLGLSLVLIPFGFIFANKFQRKIFLAFLSLFIMANLAQFSIEMSGNHKFLNAFLIIGNMYTAFVLKKFWDKSKLFRPIVIMMIFFLILSGIIDFFPIKNDTFITLSDYPISPDIQWVMKNTPGNSTFLNTSYLYANASLAGRNIFLGWPYFSWSLGYDTNQRSSTMSKLLGAQDKRNLCLMLRNNKINFIEINGNNLTDSNLPRVSSLLRNGIRPKYYNFKTNYKIYSTSEICSN